MTYKIVVPVYLGGEIVDNLISSIDVNYSHLILVDNTPDSYCKKFEQGGYQGSGINIYYYPENIGVARSWNIGLKANCDWTFLISQAAVFPNGFSEFLLELDPTEIVYLTAEGWHFVGVNKKLTEIIGYMDENIWPAYGEDWDYYRRMCLAGIPQGIIHKPSIAITSIGSSSGRGQKINFQAVYDYLTEKWGGGYNDPEEQLWNRPFGDKPLDYFPNRSVKELQNRYTFK